MIEFWNVVAAWLAGIIAGLAIHSAYLHSKRRGEIKRPLPWDHGEEAKKRKSILKAAKIFLVERRRINLISALILAASSALLVASLWQVEIATGWAQNHFTFPFFLWSVNRWWARDFWYAANIIAWLMGITAAYLLGTANREG